jgi:phenylpropionate dioxygenase-like ring-hydroxylating dioxygenase large terminal subunit
MRGFDFRVGRGTPLGQALRRYWIPACVASDLPGPDCDPIRLRLLGDSFVAFRDSSGVVGILDEACPHRLASLVYGHNGEGGLRCLWHQWKFAVDGTILETPNAPTCGVKDRLKANAYPAKESGGLIWTYLGREADPPPLPEFGWATVAERNRAVIPLDVDCSFVKALEGLMDSAHISLLHVNSMPISTEFRSTITDNPYADAIDAAPEVEVEATDFGFHFASLRNAVKDGAPARHVRIAAFVMPFLCFVAPTGSAFLSVPQDDDHTRFYNIKWFPNLPFTGRLRERWIEFMGLDAERLAAAGMTASMPGPGPLGRRNHFVQDRAGMRAGSTYSGLPGLNSEDAAMVCSIPSLCDYSGEHLTPADVAVTALRRTFATAARQAIANEPPLGVQPRTDTRLINSASGVLSPGEDWRALTPAHLRRDTGLAHEDVEPTRLA